MPQTNPFHALTPDHKLSDTELARAIRLDLEAELDAVNLYAAHLDATDSEEAKAIIGHIIDEEKEHASLFYTLLQRLDPRQAVHQAEVSEKYRLIVAGASEEEVEAVGKEGGASVDEPAAPKAFTVGGLRR